MAEKMRIGELLLLQEKIDPWVLSHTLKEQAATNQRLVSLLVSRAQLDPDEGAMVLSEQLGYPAAMQRHLERRDDAVLELLPRELGARWFVLPLARARTGDIVVVARDPTPILGAALEHAMRTSVVLAVTPSIQLEKLVRAAYGSATVADEPVPEVPPTLLDIGDVRVGGDTQQPMRRARTVSFMFRTLPDVVPAPAERGDIEATLDEIDRAITSGAVERLVMAYAATRWRSALLARIAGDRAIGQRGHGPDLDQARRLSIPLADASSISLACAHRHVVSDEPESASQDQLREVLGRLTAAAPVIAAGDVIAVLVVGEPLRGSSHDAAGELDRLVDALGAAYDRFAR